jgi:hypothetical protein
MENNFLSDNNRVTVLLFRGGMCGDLILGMTDEHALLPPGSNKGYSTVNNYRIQKDRTVMKKFFNYTTEKKDIYYTRNYGSIFRSSSETMVLSHDTDYALLNPDNVIQIICSSKEKVIDFAERFTKIHRQQVLDEARAAINSKGNFVEDYAENILVWQQAFKFKNQFDICNIGDADFLYDVCSYFNVSDTDWANNIYKEWCKNEKYLTNL